jgi:hypothetical protein
MINAKKRVEESKEYESFNQSRYANLEKRVHLQNCTFDYNGNILTIRRNRS